MWHVMKSISTPCCAYSSCTWSTIIIYITYFSSRVTAMTSMQNNHESHVAASICRKRSLTISHHHSQWWKYLRKYWTKLITQPNILFILFTVQKQIAKYFVTNARSKTKYNFKTLYRKCTICCSSHSIKNFHYHKRPNELYDDIANIVIAIKLRA